MGAAAPSPQLRSRAPAEGLARLLAVALLYLLPFTATQTSTRESAAAVVPSSACLPAVRSSLLLPEAGPGRDAGRRGGQCPHLEEEGGSPAVAPAAATCSGLQGLRRLLCEAAAAAAAPAADVSRLFAAVLNGPAGVGGLTTSALLLHWLWLRGASPKFNSRTLLGLLTGSLTASAALPLAVAFARAQSVALAQRQTVMAVHLATACRPMFVSVSTRRRVGQAAAAGFRHDRRPAWAG